MEIKIKYHNGMEQWPIEKFDKGDWIDLRAAEDVEMIHGAFKKISLGVSMQLPEGYHAQLVPRSSTFENFGIVMTNSIGIIDNSYCGDNDVWRFPALCVRAEFDAKTREPVPIKINKGDRICQFRIVRNSEPVVFNTVETLGNADRNGFGSTGVK